jgi:hypothetical protein
MRGVEAHGGSACWASNLWNAHAAAQTDVTRLKEIRHAADEAAASRTHPAVPPRLSA